MTVGARCAGLAIDSMPFLHVMSAVVELSDSDVVLSMHLLGGSQRDTPNLKETLSFHI